METNRIIVDQDNRFLITGSEFTELAILETNLNDLNTTNGGTQTEEEATFKMAKFKKIDWSSKLVKEPSAPVQKIIQNSKSPRKNLPIEQQKLELVQGIEHGEFKDGAQVDWANYLPRLRKDLQGRHPKDLQGVIWPQKQRSISYTGGIQPLLPLERRFSYVPPITLTKPKHSPDRQNLFEKNKKFSLPRPQMHKVAENFVSPFISPSQRLVNDTFIAPLGSALTAQSESMFIANEDEEQTVVPLTTKYDQTFYNQSKFDRTGNMHNPSPMGTSSNAATFISQSVAQVLSPRLTNGGIQLRATINRNKIAFNQSFIKKKETENVKKMYIIEDLNSKGQQTHAQIHADRSRSKNASRISKTINSEIETLVDKHEETSILSPHPESVFSMHMAAMNQPKPINQEQIKPRVSKQPTQLNIKPIQPLSAKKGISKAVLTNLPPVYFNLLNDETMKKISIMALPKPQEKQKQSYGTKQPSKQELDPLSSRAIKNVNSQRVVDQKQSNKDLINFTLGSSHRKIDPFSTLMAENGSNSQAKNKKRLEIVRSDFINCVDAMYRQDPTSPHHTSDYLHRVERIKEETQLKFKLAPNASLSSQETLKRNDTEVASGQILSEREAASREILTCQEEKLELPENEISRLYIDRSGENSSHLQPQFEPINSQQFQNTLLNLKPDRSANDYSPSQAWILKQAPMAESSSKQNLQQTNPGIEEKGKSTSRLGVVAQPVIFSIGNQSQAQKEKYKKQKDKDKEEIQSKLLMQKIEQNRKVKSILEHQHQRASAKSMQKLQNHQNRRKGSNSDIQQMIEVHVDENTMHHSMEGESFVDTTRVSAAAIKVYNSPAQRKAIKTSIPRRSSKEPITKIVESPHATIQESNSISNLPSQDDIVDAEVLDQKYEIGVGSPLTANSTGIILAARIQQTSLQTTLESGVITTILDNERQIANESSIVVRQDWGTLRPVPLLRKASQDESQPISPSHSTQPKQNKITFHLKTNEESPVRFGIAQNHPQEDINSSREKNESSNLKDDSPQYLTKLSQRQVQSSEHNPVHNHDSIVEKDKILARKQSQAYNSPSAYCQGEFGGNELDQNSLIAQEDRKNSYLSPQKVKNFNHTTIPVSIRDTALFKSGMTVGPRKRLRSISTKRAAAPNHSFQAKKVEEIEQILNRVVRANCCLQPQKPEQFSVMKKLVGDGSEYFENPSQKAFRIRLKFLNNNFLQGVQEDFMSTQNLERNVDSQIIATGDFFKSFEIEDPQEQQLIVRVFKRFFYNTIQKKYGYLKYVKEEKIEVSGRALCSELELNPKVLPLVGVITSFHDDAMVNWLSFLQIISLFLLRKDLLALRFKFILKFLNLTDNPEALDKSDHIQERMQRFQFAKRGFVVANVGCLALWNNIRSQLDMQREQVYELEAAHQVNYCINILMGSGIEAKDTYCFFDSLFDIQ